jgi:hypothetical protein
MGITPSNNNESMSDMVKKRYVPSLPRETEIEIGSCREIDLTDVWYYKEIKIGTKLLYCTLDFIELQNSIKMKKWYGVEVIDVKDTLHIIQIKFLDFEWSDRWINVEDNKYSLCPGNILTFSQIINGHDLDDRQVLAAQKFFTSGNDDDRIEIIDLGNGSIKPSDIEKENFSNMKLNISKTKKYKSDDFSIGERIQYKTTENTWLEAKVVSIKNAVIRIHFLGWESKWNMDIDTCIDSDRIRKSISFVPIAPKKIKRLRELSLRKEEDHERLLQRAQQQGNQTASYAKQISGLVNFHDTLSAVLELDENTSFKSSPLTCRRSSENSLTDQEGSEGSPIVFAKSMDYPKRMKEMSLSGRNITAERSRNNSFSSRDISSPVSLTTLTLTSENVTSNPPTSTDQSSIPRITKPRKASRGVSDTSLLTQLRSDAQDLSEKNLVDATEEISDQSLTPRIAKPHKATRGVSDTTLLSQLRSDAQDSSEKNLEKILIDLTKTDLSLTPRTIKIRKGSRGLSDTLDRSERR